MTRKQEGQRQIQKPRQGQGQKGQEQNINIYLSVCFSCSSLFYRTSRETNREVKSGEGGGVLECRYMTIQFIMRHEKKRGKASVGLTEDFSFPFLQQASFHHTRSKMSSKRRVKMFTFCANSTNAEYHLVQRESINPNVMQYMHKSLLANPKRIATVPLNC